MIARLRGRHRRLVVAVAAIAALGFVAALLARPTRPVEPISQPADTFRWTRFGPDEQLRAALAGAVGDRSVQIARGPRLSSPDLLVYWSSSNELRPDSTLLGALGDTGVHHFSLPAVGEGGHLLIFSRGHEALLTSYAIDELARVE